MGTFSALLAICVGIHRWPVNSPPVTRRFDGFFDWRLWINGWVNNGEACDLRRHCVHYDVSVMWTNERSRCVLCLLQNSKCSQFNSSNTNICRDDFKLIQWPCWGRVHRCRLIVMSTASLRPDDIATSVWRHSTIIMKDELLNKMIFLEIKWKIVWISVQVTM